MITPTKGQIFDFHADGKAYTIAVTDTGEIGFSVRGNEIVWLGEGHWRPEPARVVSYPTTVPTAIIEALDVALRAKYG